MVWNLKRDHVTKDTVLCLFVKVTNLMLDQGFARAYDRYRQGVKISAISANIIKILKMGAT